MTLPALENWRATRSALHQVAQVVGAIRVASSVTMENDLQYSISYSNGGFSTNELQVGGELKFDLESFSLSYVDSTQGEFQIDASEHSQQSLMDAVLEQFKAIDIDLEPSMKHITHNVPLSADMSIVKDYAHVLDAVYTALARFRARLSGFMTPIVIWPHHFDMAFIWFATSATNEHEDPHLAIGFAPFSDGVDRPYFYGYGWSKDTGYVSVDVEAPAKAITEAYTGLYAEYDILRTVADFNKTVEYILLAYQEKADIALKQG